MKTRNRNHTKALLRRYLTDGMWRVAIRDLTDVRHLKAHRFRLE